MKNFEKYETAEDKGHAFDQFCKRQGRCTNCALDSSKTASLTSCAFAWLDLDAEEETPMDCPFCGGSVVKESGKLKCSDPLCGYGLVLGRDPANTVAAHNRVCRAVKAHGEEVKDEK